MRHGVACALNADPRRTYWGGECKEEWPREKKWWYGCLDKTKLSGQVRELIGSLGAVEDGKDKPAKEIMVAVTATDDDANYSMPRIKQKIQGTAPRKINAYGDGGPKNTTGLFWHVGGAWGLVTGETN